jgi:hypothetical protein
LDGSTVAVENFGGVGVHGGGYSMANPSQAAWCKQHSPKLFMADVLL